MFDDTEENLFVASVDEDVVSDEQLGEFFTSLFGEDFSIQEALTNPQPPPPPPTTRTPFESRPAVAAKTIGEGEDAARANDEKNKLWKCQYQYIRKHPSHGTKLVTYLMASGLMVLAQSLSSNKKRDQKRVDKSVAVLSAILHSYFTAFLTLYLTLNLFFILVLSKDPAFGVGDTFPNIQEKYGVNAETASVFSYGLYFLFYLPFYVLHYVMDDWRPKLAKHAATSPLVFTCVFALAFVLLQSDLLSLNRALEFLRFDAPSMKTLSSAPLKNGKTFLWSVAWLTLVGAFINFVVSTRPKFSAVKLLTNPQETLEKWVQQIMQPATTQYLKIFVLFLTAAILWIPLGMTITCLVFVHLSWMAIPMYSTTTFSATMKKIWTYRDKMVLRTVFALMAALAAINLKDGIENIRHSVAGPTVAVVNSVILVFSLFQFVFSFLTRKESSSSSSSSPT